MLFRSDGYCTALREAVAEKYGVPKEHLIFGAGTDEVISMLGKIFIEPGDECITAAVTFSQYAAAVESMGGVMVYAPMNGDAYDLDAIAALITDKTKLIFIANPNNPTGDYFNAGAQARFLAKIPPHVTVVLDEAYQEYVTAADYPNTLETLKRYDNTILLKTFSKIYGLASIRVGFGIARAETITQMEKIRCPFNVTAQAQAAAVAALSDTEFVKTSHELNRNVMAFTESALSEMGLEYIPSQANFLMVNTRRPSMPLFEALMRKGYIIRAGKALGMENYLRVTIGTEEQMEGFIKALKEV